MKKSRRLPALGSALVLLALSACGGGGGGSSPPEAAAAPALQEGLWDTGDKSAVAYVLPASDGSAGEIWAMGATGGGPLLQGKLSLDGTRFVANSARYLTANAAEAADAQVSTETTDGGRMSFSSRVGSATTGTVVEMTESSTYHRTATRAEWSGCWQISGDTIESRLCVSESGQISGYRGACQLGGMVTLRPEAKAVVNVALQEQGCSEAASFTGIGAYGRNNGVVVEEARMLALKDVGNTRRSLVGLVKTN